jgi:hypothetical protein
MFFQNPFFLKFVVTPHQRCLVMKKKVRGLIIIHVRLGQVKQAIKSAIIGPPSFLSPFFKFQKKTAEKGPPRKG